MIVMAVVHVFIKVLPTVLVNCALKYANFKCILVLIFVVTGHWKGKLPDQHLCVCERMLQMAPHL